MGESIQVGPSWRGYSELKHLVCFGDSYTDVGYSSREKHPTHEQPLGVSFPGITWAEDDTANWVGHLITEYCHVPLLVYDYALGGDTVAGLRRQIERDFLPTVGKKPDWAPWTSEDALFVTWIGINDCASRFSETSTKAMFALQERLYEVGARNFCFIDVPPIHRSPAVSSGEEDANSTYKRWNQDLRSNAQTFATAHPDVTIFIYSSWRTFTRILNDPIAHGFSKNDVSKPYGGIWVDMLHPTSRMHDWIAKDIAFFLNERKAYVRKEVNEAAGETIAASNL